MKATVLSKSARWRRTIAALGILAVATAAVAACGRLGQSAGIAEPGALQATGIIQAEEVNVASEYGGRIAELAVEEGDRVAAGQLLIRLDTELLDAQIQAGEATLAVAQAALAQAQAGSSPSQIAVAEAQLAQSQAAQVAAQRVAGAMQELVDNPQEIGLQIAVNEARMESLRHELAAAVGRKDAAEEAMNKGTSLANELGEYPFGFLYGPREVLNLSYIPYWQGWIGVNATSESLASLQASLENLRAQRENPQEWVAKRDQARAAAAQAEAQVAAAQALVDGTKAGATPEQIAAAEARVAQAQAALDALHRQRAMRDITAPLAGTVVHIASRSGEVAAAGATILTVANTDQVTLKVYVPETRIGEVALGQTVRVTVDGLGGRVFTGQVGHIAGRAEFTPRNVATKEERVHLVFAVEVHIANPDNVLKPGMPADAVFVEQAAG